MLTAAFILGELSPHRRLQGPSLFFWDLFFIGIGRKNTLSHREVHIDSKTPPQRIGNRLGRRDCCLSSGLPSQRNPLGCRKYLADPGGIPALYATDDLFFQKGENRFS